MFCRRNIFRLLALGLIAFVQAGSPSRADLISITVTSNQPSGGFAFSPIWFGIHNGSFVSFVNGTTASAAIQAVAELGNVTPLNTSFAGNGVSTTIASSGPIPQYLPGTTGSAVVNVTDPVNERYLSFAAMFVPSNDLFVGNDNPTAFSLFDASGKFLGPKTIQVVGNNVWDAGTEVNDITNGPAFVVGQDATKGTKENGKIGQFLARSDASSYLSSISGVATPAGYQISHLISANDPILTITINTIPEPGPFVLGAAGLICFSVSQAARRARQISAKL